jgi:hypothetical protein
MRRRTVIIAVMLATLSPLVSLTGNIPAAWAVTCDNIVHAFQAYNWTHTNSSGNDDVDGVRAPIEFRDDGALCDYSAHPDSADWITIAVEARYSSGIVQMGFVSYWLGGGNKEFCSVWAIGTGQPHFYDCYNYFNDTNVYFTIHPTSDGTHYVLADCGTSGGYQVADCTVKDNSQTVWAHPEGAAFAEAYYGCGLHIFGNSSDQQNVGTSNSHIQGLDDSGTWKARSWGANNNDCSSNYIKSEQNGGETMKFYDTRNAR